MRGLAPLLAAAAAAAIAAALACCHEPQGQPPAKPAELERPAAKPEPAGSGPIELFVTGSDDGYLDACGCSDGQLGGLPRRHWLLRYLGVEDGHALLLSTGGLVAGSSKLDVDKAWTIVRAMQVMGYHAIALTERELALGRAELAGMATLLGDDCPLLATNLVDPRPQQETPLPSRRSIVHELRGKPVAVVAAIAESRAALFAKADPNVKIEPPAAAVKAELDAITKRGAKPWKTVVLAQASVAEAKELARAVPAIDLIVVRLLDGEDEPEPLTREGSTDVVTTGRKGKFVGRYRFGLGDDLGEFAPEAVIDTLEKSPSIRDVLTDYRDLIKVDRLIDAFYGREPDPNGAAYAGADEATCVQCHEKAWEIWKSSRHAHAWRTLEEQDLPETPADKKGRQKNAIWDPECVVCHTTGFGRKSGYRGLDHEKPDAPLVNVSCEACHGPSGDHAERAMKGDSSYPGGSIARVAGGAAWSLCVRCHDSDNSVGFDLKEFWVGRVRGQQREPVAHGKE